MRKCSYEKKPVWSVYHKNILDCH